MRYLLILSLFLFSCENQELIDCQSNLTTALTERDSIKADLEVCQPAWNDCMNYNDTLILNITELEGEKLNLESLVSKQGSMINHLLAANEECRDQHIEFLQDHYSVKKETVLELHKSIQDRISAGEQAYHNLMSIENPDETVLQALETTWDALNYDYGQRALIGILFPIQVQSEN